MSDDNNDQLWQGRGHVETFGGSPVQFVGNAPDMNTSDPNLEYDKQPSDPGWYPTLHSWDAQEGFFPDAHYWTGSEWRNAPDDTNTPTCGIYHWPVRCESKDAAESYAWAHDPEF